MFLKKYCFFLSLFSQFSYIKSINFLIQPKTAKFCGRWPVGQKNFTAHQNLREPQMKFGRWNRPSGHPAADDKRVETSAASWFSSKCARKLLKCAKKCASLKCQSFYCIFGRFRGGTKINIYIYKTERCVCLSVCLSVCLFVSILLPNYWTDPDQNWHGPPPGPWECPPHTFLGVPPPGGA